MNNGLQDASVVSAESSLVYLPSIMQPSASNQPNSVQAEDPLCYYFHYLPKIDFFSPNVVHFGADLRTICPCLLFAVIYKKNVLTGEF